MRTADQARLGIGNARSPPPLAARLPPDRRRANRASCAIASILPTQKSYGFVRSTEHQAHRRRKAGSVQTKPQAGRARTQSEGRARARALSIWRSITGQAGPEMRAGLRKPAAWPAASFHRSFSFDQLVAARVRRTFARSLIISARLRWRPAARLRQADRTNRDRERANNCDASAPWPRQRLRRRPRFAPLCVDLGQAGRRALIAGALA